MALRFTPASAWRQRNPDSAIRQFDAEVHNPPPNLEGLLGD